jgi:adenosylmethionine-8-amino-7-oxononanoate aminotransferase
VEQALKIAFQYWRNLGVTNREQYLVLGDAYHGDTVGSLSLGAGGFGTELFDPLRFGQVVRADGYRHSDWLTSAMAALEAHGPSLAAAVIEPLVQGASGMQMAEADDVRAFCEQCRSHGVLVVCDEVATGFGRTGRLFASELCDVRPDVMAIGKGLAAGYLPMSATVASGLVASAFEGEDLGARTFYHGHSFGGNALAAAVALRQLDLFEDWGVLANVQARSDQLRHGLADVAALQVVADVRVCGLMAGVELSHSDPSSRWGRKVCAAAVERGVLLRPLGDVVVLMPILTSTPADIDRIVSTLAEAIDCVCR